MVLRKKRVIIYGVNYYPPKGGTSRVVENLILQLKDSFDITICCYKNQLAKSHIPGVKVIEFAPLLKGSIGSLFYFLSSAFYLVLFEKADFIHAHKTDCALFLPLLKVRFNVIATSHEAPYKRDKWNALQKFYFRISERIFIRSSTVCTCISKPLSEYYQGKYNKPVIFIPNGINLTGPTDYDRAKAESFLLEGADLNKPFILFAARRLMATKGCHTMLEALNTIGYTGQIFITGEMEQTAYIKSLYEIGKGLNVHFLGFIEPLSALLGLVKESKLFVFPSETEGMSVMLLEVASVGIPIIASDIPENQQIFSNQEVLYFKSKDVLDLAEKLKVALNNEALMKNVGQRARNSVLKNFLWSDIAEEYKIVYQLNRVSL